MLTPAQADLCRGLAIGDDGALQQLVRGPRDPSSELGPRPAAMVRVAALVALDAAEPTYQREVRQALEAGASPGEILGVLLALGPLAGTALVMAAAPKIAMALGYDVERALEDAET